MEKILNYTHLSLFYKYDIEELEDEKEGFILTHDHNNGPIS